MKTPLVSFFADVDGKTYYSDHAKRFIKNCRNLNIPFIVRELETRGNYRDNCLAKPRFIMQMMQEINQSPYPAILCVDLNDVPLSYAYRQISAVLIDAFVQAGNGVDGTYIGDNFFNRIFSVNRIDYIFSDERFNVANFQTHTEDLSDHRAVTVEMELKKP
jgi:endonuclease/exonuclease/phosphatase family metal-dependent hydrolase